jgi:hypothetical protein
MPPASVVLSLTPGNTSPAVQSLRDLMPPPTLPMSVPPTAQDASPKTPTAHQPMRDQP